MIVVYYGVNLLSSRAVFQSLALPCRLSSSLHFPIPFFPLLPVSLPLNLALRPNLHPHSLPLALRLISSSLTASQSRPPPQSSSPFAASRPSINLFQPLPLPSPSPSSFVFPIPSASSSGLSISPGLAPPSPQGYTSVLQMFCPSQI